MEIVQDQQGTRARPGLERTRRVGHRTPARRQTWENPGEGGLEVRQQDPGIAVGGFRPVPRSRHIRR